jgi:hypothetical protein
MKLKMMTIIGAMTLMMAMIAGPALAANPHFLGNSPTWSLVGNTVTASGSIAGVGNQNLDLELIVNASQTVLCRNRGGNIAPGQTKFFQAATTQENLEPRNGRVNFDISATASPAGDLSGACPNPSWTPIPGDVTVHSATLNVYQPSGTDTLVLTASHTF